MEVTLLYSEQGLLLDESSICMAYVYCISSDIVVISTYITGKKHNVCFVFNP